MELVDASPVSDSQNGQHPGFAHFHPSPTISGPPFALSTPNNGDKASLLLFSNGVFPDNGTELWGTFGLHQYEDDGINRSFTLIQTPYPVPEPSALALSVLGACAALVLARRKRGR